ncbi:hypothetical protein Tco_0125793, partial [Tanacetum coccineum]
KLYLSSGSSTQILDNPQIPALHALLSENRLPSMPTTLRLRKEQLRLMTSGHEKDGTSQAAMVRNVRKVLCGRMGVFGVKHVRRLLIIQS